MEAWKEQARIPSLEKIRWVDIHGVPLSCWCNSFFKKLGGKVGEVIWIEEDTESKIRFDLGRILVIAPVDSNVSCEVKVNIGNHLFPVKLVEHQAPVTDRWVNKVLGLMPGVLNLNQNTSWGVFDQAIAGEQVYFDDVGNGVGGKAGGTKKVVSNSRGMKESRQVVREKSSRSSLPAWKQRDDRKGYANKGKGMWIHSQKPNPRHQYRYGGVKIDKVRNSVYETSADES